MAKRVGVDKSLFCATLTLVVIGLLMVFSASAVVSKVRYGSPYTFLIRQSLFAIAGLVAMTGLMQINYRRLNHPRVIFPLVGFTVLTLLAEGVAPAALVRAGARFGCRFRGEGFGPGLTVLCAMANVLDRLDEAVELIRALLPGGPASARGPVYAAKDTLNNPPPVQAHLPILIGGSGEEISEAVAPGPGPGLIAKSGPGRAWASSVNSGSL